MNIFEDNSFSIGNTPLVRLHNLDKGLGGEVYAKVEGRNPGFSVKDRVAANIVWEAEKDGRLKPGMHILEASSGNTAIGLAMVAAARGYQATMVMQQGMSEERIKVLKMLGVSLVLTDPEAGMAGAVAEAEALEKDAPERYFYARQFDNPANPAVHFKTTGPEIEASLGGAPDAVVAGVGTGGTITGLGRYFKGEKKAGTVTVGVEPASLPAISHHLAQIGARHAVPLPPAGHLIQGIGAGFIPKNLDLELLDQVETVSDKDAIQTARRLAREEGLLCGISSGAAAAVALKLASLPQWKGKRLVVILPDGGDRYVSTELFGDLFEDKARRERV